MLTKNSENTSYTENIKTSNVPEIRFKGFTEDWEQRKLGEVAPLRGGYAFKSDEYKTYGVPIIRISNILADGTVGDEFAYYDSIENDTNIALQRHKEESPRF